MRRLAAPFVMVALLAGCGEVPKPFRHEGPPSALARPKLMRGVTVRPVEGRDDGAAIAEAVVKALEPHEIPAIVQSGPAFGHVLEAQPAGDGLQWMLKSPEGETLPIYVHP
ncbi:MAG TPA: hypothetical protein VLL76_12250, partial [Candidatus Omnitrophota bacterium]|nr:hypothetical protein [Candidatus Omnitrophota bacterium]